MGKGHPVSRTYMGMRWGWPQPMTMISVGGERRERDSGVMEDASMRMYSWHCCGRLSVSLMKRRRKGLYPYPAEEMPYEDHEDPARTIFIVGIQALERILLPIFIQHGQIGGFL